MTLGGMAAAVGLIIDDSIVLVEHITRRIRGGGDLRRRIIEATIEFTRPLTGSSAATIIIFAPLAFLSGVTGALFQSAFHHHGGSFIHIILDCVACGPRAFRGIANVSRRHSEGSGTFYGTPARLV